MEEDESPELGAVRLNEDQDLVVYDGSSWVVCVDVSPSDGRTILRDDDSRDGDSLRWRRPVSE